MGKRKVVAIDKPKLKLDISFGPPVAEGQDPSLKVYERPKFEFTSYPWPLEDSSVEEIYSAFWLCRIPGIERPTFMNEVYRVLTTGGKLIIVVPYWSSPLSIQDHTHAWPPIVDHSFAYFDKQWRDGNKFNDVGYRGMYDDLKCDFVTTGGYILEQETAQRSADTHAYAIKHYLNTATNFQAVMTKR